MTTEADTIEALRAENAAIVEALAEAVEQRNFWTEHAGHHAREYLNAEARIANLVKACEGAIAAWRERVEALTAENAALAANQCTGPMLLGEGGNPYCGHERRPAPEPS